MNTEHLLPFLDAMHTGDKDGLKDHLAEDVILRSPIVVEPFEGRDIVLAVLGALLSVITKFEVTDTIIGDTHAAIILAIMAGDVEAQGVDYVHVNDEGLIDSMIIQWRPLPAIVAIQQKLAPVIGIPPLQLVQV